MKHVEIKSLKSVNVIEPFYTCLQVEVDSENEHLLSCFERVQIKVLEISSGRVKKSIPSKVAEEPDPIVTFTINQKCESQHVVTGHSSGLLKEWNWILDPPQIVRSWKSFHNGPLSHLTFDSFNGSLLASGGSDAIVKVWDTKKQYCTHHLKGPVGVITAIAFQPTPSESTFLLAASGDKKFNILLWNLITSKMIGELVGHISTVTCVQFKDQNTLISSSRDKMITVWNVDKLSVMKNIPVFESIESISLLGRIECLPSSAPVVVSGGETGMIKAFDPVSGTELLNSTESGILSSGDGLPLIKQLKYLQSRNELLVVSHENNILFHSLNHPSLPVTRQLVGHVDQVLSIKFVGSDDRFIAVASNSPNIKVYDLSTCSCFIVSGHKDTVLTIDVFNSDPSLFVSSSKDNTIRVWHFNQEKCSVRCLFQGCGHTRSVTSLVVPFKSKKWIVSGSEDTVMKLWKVKEISESDDVKLNSLSSVKVHEKELSESDDVVKLNSLSSVKAHEKDINSLAVSPNDQILCSGSQDKSAKLWSVEKDQLKPMASLLGHRRGIWCVKFSPVDQVVVTSSSDMTCRIWALNDYSCIKTFQGHDCAVLSVSFITRGMQIISTGSDGNVKIWSVKGNECQKTIDAHSDKAWTLCCSKDESHLVTGGADSRIVVWKDVTNDEVEEESNKVAQLVEAEQGLKNLMGNKRWKKALKVAIALNQPFRCLNILHEINMDGEEVVESTLNGLRNDHLICLLKYAMKWNTNSKFCLSAQQVLRAALVKIGPSELLQLPDIKEIVASFLAYTERHFMRTQRLVQQMNFLEFIFQNMRLDQVGETSETVRNVVKKKEVVQEHPKTLSQVEMLEGSSIAQYGDDSDVSDDVSEDEERPAILGLNDEERPVILGLNDELTLKENRIKQKKMFKAKMKAKKSVVMKKTSNRRKF